MNPVISPAELKPPASVTTGEHIFRSKLPDLPYIPNHLPLHDYCFEKLPYIADRPCLIVGATGKTFSYADTHLLCRKTATSLKKLGIGKGDVIMILLHNCPEFVFSFMGASMIGAVSTMANPSSTATEILNQVKSCNAKIVITESRYVNKLQYGACNSDNPQRSVPVEVITIEKDEQDRCLQFPALLSNLNPANEETYDDCGNNVRSLFSSTDPVAVPFTSGTTGQQKGVILTHKSLITSVAQQVDGDNPNRFMNKEDVVLCLLPLSHIFSLSSVLLCALRAGSTIVLMEKFEMQVMLELIEKYCVTVLVLVPPLVTALAEDLMVENFDLTSVRVVLSGAGQIGKELDADLRSRLPRAVLGQGYGMTEAGPVITMCLGFAKEPFPSKHLSCGTVVRNTEMKVINAESGSSLGYNQSGEICIRGNQIMKGYLNDDAATAETIDPDGWLHTGDIGYIDDNEEVFIVDRVKDIIKYKNFKVKPTELEALLVSHPCIADAAVVSREDEDAGEVPVAFVVRSTNRSDDHDQLISEEAIKEFMTKQLVGYLYKKLHNVFFVHNIPKSPFGKIMRKELRAKVASGVYNP